MGWVKKNLAEKGEEVRDMVIAHQAEESIKYDVTMLSNVDLKLYEVEFRLKDAEMPE